LPLVGRAPPVAGCVLRNDAASRQDRDREDSMNIDSEVRHFTDLSSVDKARFMTRLMYELTLEARNFYAAGGEQTIDANKLRFINEIQHRITRFIEQILIDDPARSSDEVMLRLLLAPRTEKVIETLVHAAYARTIQAVA
jgi:hypothetical protein